MDLDGPGTPRSASRRIVASWRETGLGDVQWDLAGSEGGWTYRKARRSCGIPWNWSNQQFVCTMWVMGIEPGSSIRLASALNYWGAFLSELIHITIMLYCLKYLLEKHQKEIWTTFIYMKKYLRGEIRIYNCASYTFHPTLNFNLRIIYIVFLATLFWWWFLTVTCRILNLCVMAVFKKFSILVTLGLWDLSTCCYVIYFHCASLRLNPV